MYEVSEGAASVCAWLGVSLARERQLDGRPSSSCEVVGLEAETDLVLWSWPRQLLPTVDTTLDPMLVEVAIQAPPANRRSASETGHGDMATILAMSSRSRLRLGKWRCWARRGTPRGMTTRVGQRRRGLSKRWRCGFTFRCRRPSSPDRLGYVGLGRRSPLGRCGTVNALR